jgi:hypothetical protein
MLDPASRIDNLDLNPIMVGAQGKGCTAVDAVIYQAGA